jgi:serine/threonine protein kinase
MGGFRLLRQLAEALDHVHTCGYLHRDVKPENVLIDKDDSVVLCDFDLAHPRASERCKTMQGTRSYLAPEIVQMDKDYEALARELYRQVSRRKA